MVSIGAYLQHTLLEKTTTPQTELSSSTVLPSPFLFPASSTVPYPHHHFFLKAFYHRLSKQAMSLFLSLLVTLLLSNCYIITVTSDRGKKSSSKRLDASSTVEALVFADNYFEFYVDGKLIKQDPFGFTPHQAVKFSFDTDTSSSRVYAIKAKDWADVSTGYEYMSAYKEISSGQKSMAKLGSGDLRVLLSDGIVSSSEWKCFTTSYGPTGDDCSNTNFDACRIQNTTEPDGWKYLGYDDSKWNNAVEYSDDEADWGLTPSYDSATRQCSTRTSPVTGKDWNPPYLLLDEDECLDPREQDWGSSVFIWQGDLEKDNTILCRIEVSPKEKSKVEIEVNKEEIKELKQEIVKEKKKAAKASIQYQQFKAEIKENKEVLSADKEALGKENKKKEVVKISKEAMGLRKSKKEIETAAAIMTATAENTKPLDNVLVEEEISEQPEVSITEKLVTGAVSGVLRLFGGSSKK